MNQPTPPPSDAIAQDFPWLIAQWRRNAETCRADAARLGEKSPCYMELLRDAAQYEQSIYQVETIRAREIAAQPGEGDLAVAIASALADFDGMDEASLHALRWSHGAQPEPMGDAWCMDYLPRGEAIVRLLATRTSPPHVADALDGVRKIIAKLRERGERTKAAPFTGNVDLLLANELEAAIAARAEAGGGSWQSLA